MSILNKNIIVNKHTIIVTVLVVVILNVAVNVANAIDVAADMEARGYEQCFDDATWCKYNEHNRLVEITNYMQPRNALPSHVIVDPYAPAPEIDSYVVDMYNAICPVMPIFYEDATFDNVGDGWEANPDSYNDVAADMEATLTALVNPERVTIIGWSIYDTAMEDMFWHLTGPEHDPWENPLSLTRLGGPTRTETGKAFNDMYNIASRHGGPACTTYYER